MALILCYLDLKFVPSCNLEGQLIFSHLHHNLNAPSARKIYQYGHYICSQTLRLDAQTLCRSETLQKFSLILDAAWHDSKVSREEVNLKILHIEMKIELWSLTKVLIEILESSEEKKQSFRCCFWKPTHTKALGKTSSVDIWCWTYRSLVSLSVLLEEERRNMRAMEEGREVSRNPGKLQ